ncbi:hypothetical protein NP493_7g03004 [Ridgeia piscesae]|uniref:Uncharacterized protein n=1 Tax=Ridgeia piscesae TaxID=27915 RepID=A0AAD9PFS1_RIDPI|nr:hypothetical protein NP493_7g03004 [Ridgeia piscesae]
MVWSLSLSLSHRWSGDTGLSLKLSTLVSTASLCFCLFPITTVLISVQLIIQQLFCDTVRFKCTLTVRFKCTHQIKFNLKHNCTVEITTGMFNCWSCYRRDERVSSA